MSILAMPWTMSWNNAAQGPGIEIGSALGFRLFLKILVGKLL